MATGISKAKGRRNSKSKKRPGFQAYPAKAGRRKVYGPIVKDKEGNVISGQRKVKPLVPPCKINAEGKELKPYTHGDVKLMDPVVFNARWDSKSPVMVPRRAKGVK